MASQVWRNSYAGKNVFLRDVPCYEEKFNAIWYL